ncbi:MAG: DUF5597 domain-containing protein, partial [Asticcacaulis sp.]
MGIMVWLAMFVWPCTAAYAALPIPGFDGRHLVVDGKPYLVLGGELANSSAASRAYMSPNWAKLRHLHLNTVLMPVSWE